MAASAYYAQVQSLYVAYFGRPADKLGLEYYAKQLDANKGNDKAMLHDFANSAESKALYSQTALSAKIASMYQTLFGRAGDIEGITYWASEVQAGKVILSEVAAAIAFNAQTADKAAFAAKLKAADAFTAKIDTAAELVAYETSPSVGRTWLANVTSDATATTAAATIDATLTAAVNGTNTTAGQTYTLTTAIDAFTGTEGNDTFVGGNGAGATTGPADQLDGGNGSDTLKLYAVDTSAAVPTFKNIENVYLNATTGGYNASTATGVTSVVAENVGAQTFTVTTGQKLGLATVAGATTITVAGNTPTSLDLSLDRVGTAASAATVALTGTALATANITGTGTASNVVLTNAGAKLATVNVAGDKAVKLSHALTTVTTINASANTAGVNVDSIGASDLTFTGGAGNDRINLVATLTAADKIDGSTGTDTLGISDGSTLTALTAANVKGFDILEATGAAAGTLDVDAIIKQNVLTGIVSSATTSATVNNINKEAVGNISVTATNTGGLTFTAKEFVSGGTSDAATIKLDNSTTKSATGIDVGTGLTFVNADVITFNSVSDGTEAKTVASGNGNSVTALTAVDLEKIVVTGDETFTLTTAATTVGLTEVDASGMTGKAALSVNTSAAANTSLLVKGTANADTINVSNAATVSTTLYTGGGQDTVTATGSATAVNTFKFGTTALNAGDLKAGDTLAITLSNGAAGGVVNLDFGSALESLLKVGGINLGTTVPNVTVQGTALGATTNVASSVAVAGAADVTTIQFDLNGDGIYSAATDAQIAITVTGIAGGNDTLVYNATTDMFVFTIV